MNKGIVKLRLAGKEYIGWEEISITRSIEDVAGTFSLTVSDPPENGRNALDLRPGDECEVLIDKTLVITGYLDSVNVDYTATSHNLRFDGRSKTKDLVDCSALQTQQFVNSTVEQIAKKLAADYGIQVVVRGDGGKPVPNFQVQPNGETVFDALQRLCGPANLLITDTPEGHLLLTNVKGTKTKNVIVNNGKLNTNIKSCNFTVGEHNRYSKIVVRGQSRATDTNFGRQVSGIMAEALDPEIRRTRIKIIRADVEVSTDDATQKALWEMKASAAKGIEINYVMYSWYGNQNELWQPGQTVEVTDTLCGIDHKDLVIARVEYRIDNSSGTTCTLVLNPAEAFEKDKEKQVKKAKLKTKVVKQHAPLVAPAVE